MSLTLEFNEGIPLAAFLSPIRVRTKDQRRGEAGSVRRASLHVSVALLPRLTAFKQLDSLYRTKDTGAQCRLR